MSRHLDWYSRGYIPHCDQPGKIQSVTIRLIDSMPAERRAEWGELLDDSRGDARLDADRRRKLEAYLDAGYGACLLGEAAVAAMVEEALLHWDGKRYLMLAWVIMPNHMHFAFEMEDGWPLGEVLKRFKGYTSHEANRMLGRKGHFWYPDYWDRYVRDRNHLEKLTGYIHQNPVKAGLASTAEGWPWSSARFGTRETRREADHEGKF